MVGNSSQPKWLLLQVVLWGFLVTPLSGAAQRAHALCRG